MKIDINVHKISDGFQASFDTPEMVIKSMYCSSFTFAILEIGDEISSILNIDILSTDNELTIKLIHEK
jgi:hypothetical protein